MEGPRLWDGLNDAVRFIVGTCVSCWILFEVEQCWATLSRAKHTRINQVAATY